MTASTRVKMKSAAKSAKAATGKAVKAKAVSARSATQSATHSMKASAKNLGKSLDKISSRIVKAISKPAAKDAAKNAVKASGKVTKSSANAKKSLAPTAAKSVARAALKSVAPAAAKSASKAAAPAAAKLRAAAVTSKASVKKSGMGLGEIETQLEMPFVNDPSFVVMPPSQLDLLMRATAALKSAVGAVSDAITDAVVREQTSMNLTDVKEICAQAMAQTSMLSHSQGNELTSSQAFAANGVKSSVKSKAKSNAQPVMKSVSKAQALQTATHAASKQAPVAIEALPLTSHSNYEGSLVPQVEPLYLDPDTLNIRTASEEAEMAAEWIELYPQGISVTSTVGRPVLVLKDQRGVEVLPVWMNPLDAGIAIAELTTSSGATPHMVSRRMMEALKIRATRCSFVELVGHHQYVVVEFEGSEDLKAIRVRADEAMSFCVQARVKFQATRAFMRLCRDVDADMEKLESGNSTNHSTGSNSFSENSSKKHPYVI